MNRAPLVTLALITSLITSPPVYAQIAMGMAGDSLTDDYLGGPAQVNNNLAAGSWGQILAATRGDDVNFGAYKSVADGTWDTIRYSGYQYNWATSGGVASNNTKATVTGLGPGPVDVSVTLFGASYLTSQTAGLAQQIEAGSVDTAYVGIGSNDFFYHGNTFDVNGNATADPSATFDQAFVDDVAGAILAGVDVLLAAGAASADGNVDLLLGLLPPGTAGGSSAAIDAGIAAVNQQLITGAAARGVATVDLWSWTLDTSRVEPNSGVISVGGLQIVPGTEATAADISTAGDSVFCNTAGECALDSHALKYAAEDGIHPNTIIQGLLANEIISALNTHHGHSIAPLTDAEILQLAGVTAVPVPAAAWLMGSALTMLLAVKRRRSAINTD